MVCGQRCPWVAPPARSHLHATRSRPHAWIASLLVFFSLDRASAQAFVDGVPAEAHRWIEERRFAARPLVLEVRLGTGTVVGALGVTASYHPWSFLGLGAGVGVNPAGAQLAGTLTIRPVSFVTHRWARLHGIGIELGYSTGPYNDYHLDASGGSPITYSWDRVHWAQPLIFYQTQSYRGVNLLAGIGAAIPFAQTGYHCEDAAVCGGPHVGAVTTATCGLGYAWGGGP